MPQPEVQPKRDRLFAVECVQSGEVNGEVIAATNFGGYCDLGGFPFPAVSFHRHLAEWMCAEWADAGPAHGNARFQVVEYVRAEVQA